MDRIIAQVPEFDGRVYDKATETTPMPYVTLGPSWWVDDSADCITARAQTVQVDVWGSNSNKGAVEDLTDDVAAALNGWSDEVIAMHPLRVTLVRVMDDPDGVSIHGLVQVEAEVEG
ncbi:DUF3168 domain-containing protein [Pontibaca methylaminivorans]|nr:DUF3168 domain-containing protein [Pontibaca methylaminivorans]